SSLLRPRGYWMSRITRMRRACWRAIYVSNGAVGGPWLYAEFWPTRTHWALWRNCASASMLGGAFQPMENEAVAALRWHRRLCAKSRPLSKRRRAYPRDARLRRPMQFLGI